MTKLMAGTTAQGTKSETRVYATYADQQRALTQMRKPDSTFNHIVAYRDTAGWALMLGQCDWAGRVPYVCA